MDTLNDFMEWFEVKKIVKPNGREYPLDIFIDQLKTRRSFRDIEGNIYTPIGIKERKAGEERSWLIPARVEGKRIEIYPFGVDKGLKILLKGDRLFFPYEAVRIKVEEGIGKKILLKPEKEKELKFLIVQFFEDRGMELSVVSTKGKKLWDRFFGKKFKTLKGERGKLTYEVIHSLIVREAKEYKVDAILIVKPPERKKVKVVDSFSYNKLMEDLVLKAFLPKPIPVGFFIRKEQNEFTPTLLKEVYMNLLEVIEGERK